MEVHAVVMCLLLQAVSIVADGIYSCPPGCRCTILKRQRDRTTASSSEQSVSPGRRVVCQRSSPVITSVSQIPLDSLPQDTLYLYVTLCCLFLFHNPQHMLFVFLVIIRHPVVVSSRRPVFDLLHSKNKQFEAEHYRWQSKILRIFWKRKITNEDIRRCIG